MSTKDQNKTSNKKYLKHFGIISSQYSMKNDRQMSEEEAKKFQETYNTQMKKLSENKEVIKDVYSKLQQTKPDDKNKAKGNK